MPERPAAGAGGHRPPPDWTHDYAEVGDGMGGTREDSGYQDIDARI